METLNLSQFSSAPFSYFSVPVLLFVLVAWNAYGALTNPLAHLPGPTISKWTNLRLQYAVVTGKRVTYVHALHERYGPVVRISPYEVSIADLAAVKTIYKVGSPYRKSNWYELFIGEPTELNMFTHVDVHAHAALRRLVAFNFSEKWINNLEPYISKNVRLAIARMANEVDTKGYSDVFKWFTFMATDVIGEASFGESFRMLETGKKDQYVKDLEEAAVRGMLRSEFPLLTKIMSYSPWGSSKEVGRSVLRMRKYSEESIARYWRQLKAEPDNIKPTLLTKAYAAVEGGAMSVTQLEREAGLYIVAGTDTTAITASYAVWILAHHREIEEALIREVSALPDGFTDKDLRSLTLLNNVISETLRLRAPVAQSLPRVVPEGGAEFCGHHIPKGTIVGVQAWTMHYNPTVWAEPEKFNPARWDAPSKDMLHSYYPFGGGSRACIGSHFALLELRHALANFYRAFEGGVIASDAEQFSEADMGTTFYFMTLPKAKRCLLKRRK